MYVWLPEKKREYGWSYDVYCGNIMIMGVVFKFECEYESVSEGKIARKFSKL